MTKSFSLLLCALMTGCSLQTTCHFGVYLHNACSYPVQINAIHHLDTVSLEPAKMNQRLDPGETILVLSIAHIADNVEFVVPEKFKLEISANDKTISLDKMEFLKVLEKAKYHPYGTTSPFWTVNDSALCPK